MQLLSRAMILAALEELARELAATGMTRQEEIVIAGGAAPWRDDVDIGDARLLLPEIQGGRDDVWSAVEPFLVPGRELKARYAFEDLWESVHGS